MVAPAAALAPVGLGVRVALEAFEDVVSLQAQFGGAFGCGDGAHAAAAQQHHLLAGGHGGAQAVVKSGVHRHARPLFPGQRHGTGHKAHPLALGVGAHIHQHSLTSLHPVPGQVGRHIPRVAAGRARLHQLGAVGVVANARCEVGRHRLVHALGTWQVEGVHDGHKLVPRLACHPGVVRLFPADGRLRLAFVVVAGPDRGAVGQREQDLGQAAVQVFGAARLEVAAAAAVDEQGVAREHVVLVPHRPQVTHAAGGVARRVQGTDVLLAKHQLVAVLQLHRRGGDATPCGRRRFGTCEFGQLAGAGDVVGVGVGFHRPGQLQAVVFQAGQIALDLLVHRVDDQRLARGGIEQHVGVGAGSGVEQLNGFHGRFLTGGGQIDGNSRPWD